MVKAMRRCLWMRRRGGRSYGNNDVTPCLWLRRSRRRQAGEGDVAMMLVATTTTATTRLRRQCLGLRRRRRANDDSETPHVSRRRRSLRRSSVKVAVVLGLLGAARVLNEPRALEELYIVAGLHLLDVALANKSIPVECARPFEHTGSPVV